MQRMTTMPQREETMRRFALKIGSATVLAITFALATLPANAADVTTEWTSIKAPPAPQLKSVTVDPRTTALLVLDLMKNNCGARPRCQAMVPSVKKLIDAARANNMMIAYNLTGSGKVEDMVDQSLAPRAGEHLIKEGRGANKFY